MGEIININVGGAGCNIGSKVWQQLELNPQHFQEGQSNHKPKIIFINSNEDCQFEKSINLASNQKFFIKEDAANINYFGYYVNGKQEIELIKNEVRKQVENCDHFQGFLYTHSISGGIGSGFTGLLSEYLDTEHPKQDKLSFCLVPSPNFSNIIVEPYNAIIGLNQIVRSTGGVIFLQNEAIYDFLENKIDVELPSYNEINEAISFPIISLIRFLQKQQISQITLSLSDSKDSKLLSCSYGSIQQKDQILKRKEIDLQGYNVKQKNTVYRQGLLNLQGEDGMKYMIDSIFKYFPQNRFSIHQQEGQKQVQFQNLIDTKRKALFLSQNTDLNDQIKSINHKAQILFKKRAFVHWYVGIGIEDQSFQYEFSHFQDFVQNQEELFLNLY